MGLAGTVAYVAVRDDGQADPPETSTTTTVVTRSALTDAIARSLADGLDVALTRTQARCVARALLAVVDAGELEALEALIDPSASLASDARARLVRGVVGCVPSDVAAALLGGSTSTTVPVQLPDEGG